MDKSIIKGAIEAWILTIEPWSPITGSHTDNTKKENIEYTHTQALHPIHNLAERSYSVWDTHLCSNSYSPYTSLGFNLFSS